MVDLDPGTRPWLPTAREAAHALGIPARSVQRHAALGDLPAIRLGRKIYVPRVALEQWLARHSKGDVGHENRR